MSYIDRYDTPSPIEEVHAMNAMCIWEAVLERHLQEWKGPDRDDSFYQWFTMGEGVWEGRQYALTLAGPFETAYNTISDDYNDAFDWEFIPAMLDAMYTDENRADLFDLLDQETLNRYAQEILDETN